MIPQSKGTMVLAFVAGTVLAVGHHIFYSHLAGRVPSNVPYSMANIASLTGQQINLAIGAIFVFFAKNLFDHGTWALKTAHPADGVESNQESSENDEGVRGRWVAEGYRQHLQLGNAEIVGKELSIHDSCPVLLVCHQYF